MNCMLENRSAGRTCLGSMPGKGKGQRTIGGEALKRKEKRAKVREGGGL